MSPMSPAEKIVAERRTETEAARARREHPTRGHDLVKVVNAHGGAVCDIEPGHTGLVNPRNAGVAGMISAGMLIRADASDDKSVAARHNVDHAAEMRALSEALARTERESADRLAEINALHAQVRELRGIAAAMPERDARVSELEAECARLRADLDAVTAPSLASGAHASGAAQNGKRAKA